MHRNSHLASKPSSSRLDHGKKKQVHRKIVRNIATTPLHKRSTLKRQVFPTYSKPTVDGTFISNIRAPHRTFTAVESELSDDKQHTSSSWEELGISPSIAQTLVSNGFETPSKVQKVAIPLALKSADLVIGSHTGQGKTLSYLVPISQKLHDDEIRGHRSEPSAPRALVLVPNRELVQQVLNTAKTLCHADGYRFRPLAVHGHESIGQLRQLLLGSDSSRERQAHIWYESRVRNAIRDTATMASRSILYWLKSQDLAVADPSTSTLYNRLASRRAIQRAMTRASYAVFNVEMLGDAMFNVESGRRSPPTNKYAQPNIEKSIIDHESTDPTLIKALETHDAKALKTVSRAPITRMVQNYLEDDTDTNPNITIPLPLVSSSRQLRLKIPIDGPAPVWTRTAESVEYDPVTFEMIVNKTHISYDVDWISRTILHGLTELQIVPSTQEVSSSSPINRLTYASTARLVQEYLASPQCHTNQTAASDVNDDNNNNDDDDLDDDDDDDDNDDDDDILTQHELAQKNEKKRQKASRSKKNDNTTTLDDTRFTTKPRLARNADMIIATPAKIAEMVKDDVLKLSNVRYLVLDEADLLLTDRTHDRHSNSQEQPQPSTDTIANKELYQALTPILRRIRAQYVNKTGYEPQTKVTNSVFRYNYSDSAIVVPSSSRTLVNNEPIQFIYAGATLNQRFTDELARMLPLYQAKHMPRDLQQGMADGHLCLPPTLEQTFIQVGSRDKLDILYDLLGQPHLKRDPENPQQTFSSSTMVFCNTVASARAVYHYLNERNVAVVAAHSGVPPQPRKQAWATFHNNKSAVMVCTDIASRGIDTHNLKYVINFDFPYNPVDYLHRAGRTHRLSPGQDKPAPNQGHVISLLLKGDQVLAGAIHKASQTRAPITGLSSDLKAYKQADKPENATSHRDMQERQDGLREQKHMDREITKMRRQMNDAPLKYGATVVSNPQQRDRAIKSAISSYVERDRFSNRSSDVRKVDKTSDARKRQRKYVKEQTEYAQSLGIDKPMLSRTARLKANFPERVIKEKVEQSLRDLRQKHFKAKTNFKEKNGF